MTEFIIQNKELEEQLNNYFSSVFMEETTNNFPDILGNQGEQRNCIRFKCVLTNTILDVLRQRAGWVEVKDEGEWDFYWCDISWLRENFGYTYMDEHVRVCHFRNHYELTRKNFMVKNLKRFRKQLEREQGKLEAAKCDFFPKTFELPIEYHLFVEEFKRNPGITWIMKPVARSQGKGIFLFRKLKDIMEWRKDGNRADDTKDEVAVESYVVQRYIENPYLIGGRKFDLRVYVLVTSYVPLKAWLYRDGFARFSNTRFSLTSIDDHFIHLTNVAVQKTAPDYDPEKKPPKISTETSLNSAEIASNCFRNFPKTLQKTPQSAARNLLKICRNHLNSAEMSKTAAETSTNFAETSFKPSIRDLLKLLPKPSQTCGNLLLLLQKHRKTLQKLPQTVQKTSPQTLLNPPHTATESSSYCCSNILKLLQKPSPTHQRPLKLLQKLAQTLQKPLENCCRNLLKLLQKPPKLCRNLLELP
ncbi:probable tubulin polyglutamylase TTLL9 [Carcharodon carcharias]|uniref:probable tubulin polyglutamylase TTLL9 n=1 Tax=Carcharodon carcharias TaxID=13397 RepID=UPI001B7DD1B8|nr:probable tubulin polyglutamylase TTLL9 [Carcharodon carcharias]